MNQVEQRVINQLIYPIENSTCKLLSASKPPINVGDLPDIKLKG